MQLVKLHCAIPVDSEQTNKEVLKKIVVDHFKEQIADYVTLVFDHGTQIEGVLAYHGYLVLADTESED